MNTIARIVRAILFASAALCALETHAAAPASACAPEKAATTDMGEAVYRDVQSAMELLASKKYDEAIQKLQKIADKGSDYENEVKNLYSVYMVMELPFKAGMLMEGAIEKNRVPGDEASYESLADAWINAREATRAETVLKKLAGMSEKGEYYFKLGAMYGDDERWKESKEMLDKALAKGGLKRSGDAWMRLAMAEHGLKNTPAAIAALQKAVGFDETRKQAGEWLRHLRGQVASQQSAESEAKTSG